MTSAQPSKNRRGARRIGRFISLALTWIIAAAASAWAFGALHYDFPVMRTAVSWGFLIGVLAVALLAHGTTRKLAFIFGMFAVVLGWWFTLQPRNDRSWQPDVAQLAWAEVDGDEVTLHNVRNCDYRTETDFTPRWETRKVKLSSITGVDLFINYWGSPWMAHPIASFQFADALPVCFTIETRKEEGEKYSAIGGIYRQYELVYIASDERDVVRLRTNFRKGEESYLYHTRMTPERARQRFMEYVSTINSLRERPRWYNALTTNCTTAIRTQHPTSERAPWDWRMLVNGKGDEMLHERNMIFTGGLPFAELRQKALINPSAQAADKAEDFSRLIRDGRPGFSPSLNATLPSSMEKSKQ